MSRASARQGRGDGYCSGEMSAWDPQRTQNRRGRRELLPLDLLSQPMGCSSPVRPSLPPASERGLVDLPDDATLCLVCHPSASSLATGVCAGRVPHCYVPHCDVINACRVWSDSVSRLSHWGYSKHKVSCNETSRSSHIVWSGLHHTKGKVSVCLASPPAVGAARRRSVPFDVTACNTKDTKSTHKVHTK